MMEIVEYPATSSKLQRAIEDAFAIDNGITRLLEQIQELISDLQGEQRAHEAGILIGVSANLRDSYYRKLGGLLQDMQR